LPSPGQFLDLVRDHREALALPISSDLEATVCTLREICSAAGATTPPRVAASPALPEIDSGEALSWPAAAARADADSAVEETVLRRLSASCMDGASASVCTSSARSATSAT